MKLFVRTVSILDSGCEAIVNAANSGLLHGGGVCGAIFSAAGPEVLQRACTEIGGCDVGSAVATPSFGLSDRGISTIIHAVGPVWAEHSPVEGDRLLSSAYADSLRIAETLGVRSIAVPAISTGIFGFPAERAARVVAETLIGSRFMVEEVHLVALDSESSKISQDALTAVGL